MTETVIRADNVTDITDAVDAAIGDFLADRRAEADAIGPGLAATVADLASYVSRGGKRVRPTFAWLGWLGAGGAESDPDAPAVLRTCAALELLHASALIHDDIIDESPTRRGLPAAHVLFADRHRARRWSGAPNAFGQGMAILAGDLTLAWADDLVRTSGLRADAQARVGPVWSAMRTEVLYGQLLDLTAQAAGAEDVDSALRVDRYKTASYTVERPLHVGAAIAGAGTGLVAAYRAFGTDIGIAFQLRDDVLGMFGDPLVTGKPSGDDLREGKRTVLLATALELADDNDPGAARFLRSAIGTDISAAQLDSVRAILTETGAVDRVERDIVRRTDRAVAALEASGATAPARDRLAAMAVAATQRAW
ncbi:polyprenyl synthetase family protein [Actinophytocola sp.]|jgi:geranylgeranyl diphosphate synthase type I|uniref:polyprenyl synthetase family protein n=1 Tax=Actinophytocola sp. TaxID=1872138 RepID=UPI002EDADA92